MSLQDAFYHKSLDLLSCPSPIVDKNGESPLAKGFISKFMSKSHVLVPLLASTSVLAIDAYCFNNAHILDTLTLLFTSQLPHVIDLTRKKLKIIDNPSIDKVEYYINRTEERVMPVPENILLDLELKKSDAQRGLKAGALISATILPAFAYAGLPVTAILGIMLTYSVEDLSKKRRAERVLEGAWGIDKEPPKVLAPSMVPA